MVRTLPSQKNPTTTTTTTASQQISYTFGKQRFYKAL
jgi:hypothetical protein